MDLEISLAVAEKGVLMLAAIYARKSTDQADRADEAKSVTRQVEHATVYAIRKGWTVDPAHVYVDNGISGTEFLKRPAFLRLMNSVKPRPPFQVLIMSEESRLGREQIETAYALKQLVTAGVRVFYYLEDRERTLDCPTDNVLMAVHGFSDEMAREQARQRTHDALARKAAAGHVTGGTVYGYVNVRVNGHVERQIHDPEAAVVRRLFELSAGRAGARGGSPAGSMRRGSPVPCPAGRTGRARGHRPACTRC